MQIFTYDRSQFKHKDEYVRVRLLLNCDSKKFLSNLPDIVKDLPSFL